MECLRTAVQFRPPPPIMKPQPFSVGVFSCPIAPVPACSWGFLRKPADYAGQTLSPFRATFHSLLAIPRSDLAPWSWPEVRKGRNADPYRSKSYARTNQAVGLQHRVAMETLRVRFVGSYRALPTPCNAEVRAWMVAKIRNALSGQCPDEYNKSINLRGELLVLHFHCWHRLLCFKMAPV